MKNSKNKKCSNHTMILKKAKVLKVIYVFMNITI